MKSVQTAVVMLGLAFGSAAMASDINVWVEATDFDSSDVTVGTTCGTLNYRVFAELGDNDNQGLALIGYDLEFDGGALDPASPPADGSMDSLVKPAGLTNPAGYGGTLDNGKLLQVGGGANTIMNGQVPCTSNADCPAGSNCDTGGTGLCDPVADFPVGTVVTGIAAFGSPQVVAEGVLNIPVAEGSYTLAITNVFANVITAGTTGVPFYATEAATPGTSMPLSLTVEVDASCTSQSIVGSDPPSGAIDAREPHLVGDAGVVSGWDSVELTMSGAPPVTANIADFSLSEVGGDGVPPTIIGASVTASSTIRLDFDAPIEPQTWTMVTHNASGSSICLGYLPADANQDGLSASNDIIALIDSINLVPGRILPDYATDINRSGVTTGSDILRLIDLLNGASEFDVWIARSLLASPCP